MNYDQGEILSPLWKNMQNADYGIQKCGTPTDGTHWNSNSESQLEKVEARNTSRHPLSVHSQQTTPTDTAHVCSRHSAIHSLTHSLTLPQPAYLNLPLINSYLRPALRTFKLWRTIKLAHASRKLFQGMLKQYSEQFSKVDYKFHMQVLLHIMIT